MAGGSKLPKAQDQAGGWPQPGQPQQQQPPTGYGHPPGEHGAAYGQAAPPACGSQPPMGATGYAAPPSAPPAGYGYGAPQAHQAPGGYGQAPGGYGQAPGGYGQVPGGYGQAPGGYGAPPAYGQPQQQQYPPVQQGYPPAGVPGFPPGTDPQVAAMFQQADGDRSGSIDANELGRVLSTGRVPFSPRTLRLMLHLFSDNKADPSRIGPAGFAKLWKEIQQWNKKFHEFDRDNSGSIEVAELSAALLSFNFNIPPTVLQMLVAKYDVTGGSRSIGYDNFVECGLIVKGLTQKFKDQDRALSGNATFDYTSFMLLVIPFVAA